MSTKRFNRQRKGHSLFAALAVIAAVLVVVMSALQFRAADGMDGRIAAGSIASAHAQADPSDRRFSVPDTPQAGRRTPPLESP